LRRSSGYVGVVHNSPSHSAPGFGRAFFVPVPVVLALSRGWFRCAFTHAFTGCRQGEYRQFGKLVSAAANLFQQLAGYGVSLEANLAIKFDLGFCDTIAHFKFSFLLVANKQTYDSI
jgi:hypothetical protein